ncbi:unnamed protein product [Lactuca virosa]|uniref:Uncharacterized protein n=1 Tax=Lactuca virosa TaxID=75947 RepID=A0AAU9NEP4_9ASTR|nr:unnamed protein product [Lactuca virosa]
MLCILLLRISSDIICSSRIPHTYIFVICEGFFRPLNRLRPSSRPLIQKLCSTSNTSLAISIIGAVVVEHETNVNCYKIQYAILCICENPRCVFIATHIVVTINMTDLQELSGVGCVVVVVCGGTEKELNVVGKPPTFLMDLLQKMYQSTIQSKLKHRTP